MICGMCKLVMLVIGHLHRRDWRVLIRERRKWRRFHFQMRQVRQSLKMPLLKSAGGIKLIVLLGCTNSGKCARCEGGGDA